MSRLLHIQSSPNLMTSVTRKLSMAMVEEYCRTHANVEVETLDLVTQPLPHYGMDNMAAMMLPPEQQSPEMRAAAALQDRLITQLENANVVVIGAPMINFTICTQLKSWFDHVTLVGRTFQYSAPGQAKGLLFGHKTFIIEARGGDYSDPPFSAFDYQEPLLRMLCMFIGLYDIHFIRAEGLRAKEEEAPFIVQRAERIIAQLAA